MKGQWSGLVGDVGGTHARLALVDPQGHIRHPKIYNNKEFGSLADIMGQYMDQTVGRRRPPRAVIAVAGPVMDGEMEFTNLDWQLSEGDLISHFEFEAVKLINDFAAQALACPRLDAGDLRNLGGPKGRGAHNCPIIVLGAGTGFGIAGLARSERGDVAIATEGGHAGFAPSDDFEVEVWTRMRAKHGRVSVERLLSGAGLYELYVALGDIKGSPGNLPDEVAVMTSGLAGEPLASETLDRFGAIMGSVAGDLSLEFGARGGVFVSGGIAPRMADRLAKGAFRARFEDKGRLTEYVAGIPTNLVLHPYPAIVGAARELEQMERL